MDTILLAFFLILASVNGSDAQTGVSYGMLGNNLPSPKEVVSLFTQNNIKRMRIYAPNQAVFKALQGTEILLMLNVPNAELRFLALRPSIAVSWVRKNVLNNPNILYIVVGNEVRPDNSATSQFASHVLPAMQNIKAAVDQLHLRGTIKVSTAFDMGVIGTSYPPSAGIFSPSIQQYVTPIVQFLASNNYPLMMNIYPYFAYASTPEIRLDYALFTARGTVVTDPGNGLHYQNLFDAMVDSVYSALEKAGAQSVPIVVSETGWPTAGGKSTDTVNAWRYNNNLISHVKTGTPKRPGRELETYIFAMFDENQKTPELEKHWGLFFPNKRPKYHIKFS